MCCKAANSICWTALLAYSSDPPNRSLAGILPLLNRYAANHAKEKLNKCRPLFSKNNMCLNGLKYNLYLQKCTVFITAFLPHSTTSHCCSCLNSVMELHLWQLSKPWKKAVSGSTNPLCCSRHSLDHKTTCTWGSLYSCLRKKTSLYPVPSRSMNRTYSSLSLCQWELKETDAFQTSPVLFKIWTAKVVMLIESRNWNNATQHMQAFTANQPSWNFGYWIFSGKLFAINPQHVNNTTLPPPNPQQAIK